MSRRLFSRALRAVASVVLLSGVLGVSAASPAHAAAGCTYWYAVGDIVPAVTAGIPLAAGVETYWTSASLHTSGCAALTIDVEAEPVGGTPYACAPLPQHPLSTQAVCLPVAGGYTAVGVAGLPVVVVVTIAGVGLDGSTVHDVRECILTMPASGSVTC